MSWCPDDPSPFQTPVRTGGDCPSRRKGQAKAQEMMHPDDITKIAFLLIAGSAAAICIFTLRLLAAGLGG